MKPTLLILILLAAALLTPGCGKADPDAEVLDRVKLEGVDLTKPQSVDFFLYFGSEADVTKAADQIRAMGFKVEISPPKGSAPDWLCRATRTMNPDLAEFHALRQKFEPIATTQSGVYNGWSIAAMP